MNRADFVRNIFANVYEVAVRDTVADLIDVPGKKPSEVQTTLSRWYLSLEHESRNQVSEVARQAAQSAVFGFLAVLDGVRVNNDDDSACEVTLTAADENRNVLNDWSGQLLHDIFQGMLKSHHTQTPGQNGVIDIHHVPAIEEGLRQLAGYDPSSAPAIALPTREHRNLPGKAGQTK